MQEIMLGVLLKDVFALTILEQNRINFLGGVEHPPTDTGSCLEVT
jgi:hypothetical protein